MCNRRPQLQNIRETAPVLWRPEREHPDVVRARLLRQPDREALVGTVQAAAVARHACSVHQCRHTAKRKTRQNARICRPHIMSCHRHPPAGRTRPHDAPQHYALLGDGVRHHVDANLVAREASLPDAPAPGRCGHHAGQREEDFRDNGRQESDVQVLDAAGVGHEHHQSGAQGEDHRVRSHCADAAR